MEHRVVVCNSGLKKFTGACIKRRGVLRIFLIKDTIDAFCIVIKNRSLSDVISQRMWLLPTSYKKRGPAPAHSSSDLKFFLFSLDDFAQRRIALRIQIDIQIVQLLMLFQGKPDDGVAFSPGVKRLLPGVSQQNLRFLYSKR